MPRNATEGQVSTLEAMLTEHKLYAGHYDRLWKQLEGHRLNQRRSDDGCPMPFALASATVKWLARQIDSGRMHVWETL
jgi:hypothetical protein